MFCFNVLAMKSSTIVFDCMSVTVHYVQNEYLDFQNVFQLPVTHLPSIVV